MGASSERVGSTIVEGFGQSTDRAFAEYLYRSNASSYEIRNQLRVAKGRGYVTETECDRLSAQYDEIARMNSGLIKHLKREDRRDRLWNSRPPRPRDDTGDNY